MKDLVKVALKIATKAHEGQFRNDGKTPYITHPIEVANLLKKELNAKGTSKKLIVKLYCAALLHDVLEDSSFSELKLKKNGMSQDVINLVKILTHKKECSYFNYILEINKNPFAKVIKRNDIKHNLSTLEPWKKDKRDKYMLALYLLEH